MIFLYKFTILLVLASIIIPKSVNLCPLFCIFQKIYVICIIGAGGGGAQWANFMGQVEIILWLVSDNHLHLHVVMF